MRNFQKLSQVVTLAVKVYRKSSCSIISIQSDITSYTTFDCYYYYEEIQDFINSLQVINSKMFHYSECYHHSIQNKLGVQ